MPRSATREQSARFITATRTLAVFDLIGFLNAVRGMSEAAIVELLDDYYRLAAAAFAAEEGRVVKHLGDAVLGVFPGEHHVQAAVRSFRALEAGVAELPFASAPQGGVRMRGCIHVGEVTEGAFGAADLPDVIGAAVNTLFMMEGPRRLVLSEKAYRRLPSEVRGGYARKVAPTVYLAARRES